MARELLIDTMNGALFFLFEGIGDEMNCLHCLLGRGSRGEQVR